MPFPIFLLGGLLLFAILTYLFRDWDQVGAFAAALLVASIGIALWLVPPEQLNREIIDPNATIQWMGAVERFNFTLQLNVSVVPLLVAALLISALALFCAAFLKQGRYFVPGVLLLLGGYVTLFLIDVAPIALPLIAPIMLALLSAGAIFLLQAERVNYAGGPLRALIPPILALPFCLIASWYLDQSILNPQANYEHRFVEPLLAIAFLLLAAPAPLHSAQPASAQTAPPIASALTTLLYQLALFHLLQVMEETYPYMRQGLVLEQMLILFGLLTAIWGGLAAIGTGHLGKLWGYTSLHDWGLILLMLSSPQRSAWTLAFFLFALRAVSMMTAALGLAALEQSGDTLHSDKLKGAGGRLPWASAAFLLGGLGLAGFPLSAGFTGHWSALLFVAQTDWRAAAAILLASTGAVIGFVRIARVLFGRLENRYLFRETNATVLLAACVLFLSISLAIAPQLLDAPISRVVTGLSP